MEISRFGISLYSTLTETDFNMALDKNYMRLAQFHNFSASRNDIIKDILKDKAVNYQVPANPNLQHLKLDLEGCTALHVAIKANDYESFVKLIRHNADFTIKNSKGETVIHEAINIPIKNSKTLLECKSRAYLGNRFITAVFSAHVSSNNSTNPSDRHGVSHFHVACVTNNIEAIKFFLKTGVSVNQAFSADAPALPGFTPLHCAARYSNVVVARILLEHGAIGHCKDAKGLTPLHLLIKQNMEIVDWIHTGRRVHCSYLFNSELKANDRIIELILKKHSTHNLSENYVIDDTGLSRLHIACTFENTLLVEQLLEDNTDLEQAISANSPLWPGYTPLHIAAHFNVDTVKLLINKGANVLVQDINGTTPFDLCMDRYDIEVIEFLINSRWDWKYIRFSDNTFLPIVIQAMRNKYILSSFLEDITKNANAFIPHYSPLWPGYTPLHLAVNFAGRYKDFNEIFEEPWGWQDVACESLSTTRTNRNCPEDREQFYLERIKLMLGAGADATVQDSYGSTPIHHAFLLQREDVVNLLLEHHKSTIANPTNNDGLSHLHIACAAGNHKLVLKLLSEGFDVNLQTSFDYKYKKTYHVDAKPTTFFFTAGSTPLHIAVIVRDTEMVRILILYGADLNAGDDENMTPVHRLLAQNFYFQVVQIGKLLFPEKGFQNRVTRFGLSHLHVASHVNNVDAVKRLLDLGADVNATVRCEKSDIGDDESLSFLSSYSGYTPMDFAVRDSCFEAFDVLLDHGVMDSLKSICAPNFENFVEKLDELGLEETLEKVFGARKLHKACFSFEVDKVKKLLKTRYDLTMDLRNMINSRIPEDSKTFRGFTPLHLLLRKRRIYPIEEMRRIVTLLINSGADVTLKNLEGATPVSCVFNLETRLVKQFANLLIGHMNRSVNPIDSKGISHFHVACICNRFVMISTFIEKGVDVNQNVEPFTKIYGGYTPLHFAAHFKSEEAVKVLLKHGANVHARDSKGNTPLHCALMSIDGEKFNEVIVISLIRADADLNAKNLEGKMPIEQIATEDEILRISNIYRVFVNLFDKSSGYGYIAIAIKSKVKIKCIMENPVFAWALKWPAINGSDEMNRTPIHNIVSVNKLKTPLKIYMKAIHALVKLDIDIDQQDTNGETALHYAVKFHNVKAIVVLLALGADINKAAPNMDTPFVRTCTNPDGDVGCRAVYTMRIMKKFWKQAYKLQLVGLFLCIINKRAVTVLQETLAEYTDDTDRDTDVLEQCQLELKRLRSRKIGLSSVTLHSFLFETASVTSYPNMLLRDRQAIDHLFQSRNFRLYEEFPEFSGILQMQYKKALRRVNQLLEPAKSSLDIFTKFVLPDLCAHHILKFLRNDDLERLIVADEEIMLPPQKRRKLH